MIVGVDLFGSLARGEGDDESDIDFCILTPFELHESMEHDIYRVCCKIVGEIERRTDQKIPRVDFVFQSAEWFDLLPPEDPVLIRLVEETRRDRVPLWP